MPDYNIPLSFRFKVEFELKGEKPADDTRFQEVTGLAAEVSVETLEEGGENQFTHRFPGRAKYENLVLKRGMFTDSNLIKWFNDAVVNFTFTPVNVTVHLLNEKQQTLETWYFNRAWPVKWSFSDFKAQENALVIETIELAYTNFERGKKKKN